MATISPFLWFDNTAEEAADFYLSIFPNARKTGGLSQGGKAITLALELEGQKLTFLNGGPGHKLTDAFSLVVTCADQAEIDHYWALLTEGGSEVACGWLKDQFGVSWQIVPANLADLLSKPGAMQAMMKMKKLEIAGLEAAGA
jgi:predicted 3-demethylubiquinone-9 3-methyltransferase (glyoxalase superfamily)